MAYSAEKFGCRVEVSDDSVKVSVRFRGSVTIPLSDIQAVRSTTFSRSRVIEIDTRDGTYQWALGDKTDPTAAAIASAAHLPLGH